MSKLAQNSTKYFKKSKISKIDRTLQNSKTSKYALNI